MAFPPSSPNRSLLCREEPRLHPSIVTTEGSPMSIAAILLKSPFSWLPHRAVFSFILVALSHVHTHFLRDTPEGSSILYQLCALWGLKLSKMFALKSLVRALKDTVLTKCRPPRFLGSISRKAKLLQDKSVRSATARSHATGPHSFTAHP